LGLGVKENDRRIEGKRRINILAKYSEASEEQI